MMTLDCKLRQITFPSSHGPSTNPKLPVTKLARPRNPIPQPVQINTSLTRRSGAKDSTGDSFLQRLLEIERRHDEKRLFRQRAATKNVEIRNQNKSSGADEEHPAFNRSPTRWISEQIFDDTQENTNPVTASQPEPFHTITNNKLYHRHQPFYTSSMSRLPNLSDVHVIASTSNISDPSSSSVFMPANNKQTDGEYPMDSLSTISYVELQPSDDFPPRSPVIRKRPLKLPPILLPPIYSLRPRPLKERDFLTPTRIRGPITDDEWEDLRQCRYIRPAPPGRFEIPVSSSASQVSL